MNEIDAINMINTLLITQTVTAIGLVVVAGLFAYLCMRTPALTYLRAKALGYIPLENGLMKLVSLDGNSEVAVTKDCGLLLIKRIHAYVEAKSGKPIFLMSRKLGSISIGAAEAVNRLQELGIQNAQDFLTALKAKAPSMTDLDFCKSLGLSEIPNYFFSHVSGDVLEAKVQHRTTVEAMKKNQKDYMKYLVIGGVILAIVMVAGALAFAIVNAGAPAVQAAQQAAVPVVQQVTGAGIGVT